MIRPISLFALATLVVACSGGTGGSADPIDDAGAGDVNNGSGDTSSSDADSDADAVSDASAEDTGAPDAQPDSTNTDAAEADASTDATADSPADSSADSGVDAPPEDDCPDELFVQADAHPDNSAYPAPRLAARCEDGQLIVESNGIIGYEFQAMTPNALTAQTHEWTIPLEPTWSETTTDIPLLGDIGFSVSGIVLYGPNEAAFPDPYGDPVYNDIVDWCLGHTGAGGVYHLHAMLVECIVDGIGEAEPSPIIGFALDGYPIHGPVACANVDCTETLTVRSGWVQTGDPTTYAWDNHEYTPSEDPAVLDQCNGRIGPDGEYRYHATATFPYILGCFHGVAEGGGGLPDDGGGDPPDEPGACVTVADCPDTCGPAAGPCACATTPRGSICVPGCDTADDCPTDSPMPLTCRDGACVPSR